MSNNSMKNLFTKTLRNKQTRNCYHRSYHVCFSYYQPFYYWNETNCSITVNGKQQEIQTHADTVGDLLTEQNIQISNADLVSPSVNTLIEDGLSVKWEQANKITITVDGKKQTIQQLLIKLVKF